MEWVVLAVLMCLNVRVKGTKDAVDEADFKTFKSHVTTAKEFIRRLMTINSVPDKFISSVEAIMDNENIAQENTNEASAGLAAWVKALIVSHKLLANFRAQAAAEKLSSPSKDGNTDTLTALQAKEREAKANERQQRTLAAYTQYPVKFPQVPVTSPKAAAGQANKRGFRNRVKSEGETSSGDLRKGKELEKGNEADDQAKTE